MIQVQKLADALAVTKAGTSYSNHMMSTFFTGYCTLRIISTAGSITISQQCSLDGVTFYDPVDESGTALGVVASGLTVTTGKIVQFSPVLTKFIRFKIVEANVAASAVTLDLTAMEK